MAVLSSLVSLHSEGCSRHRSYAVTLFATSFDLSLSTRIFRTLPRFLKRGTEAMSGTYNLDWHFLRSPEVYRFFLALQGVLWYFAFSILVFGLVKRLFLFYWLSMGLKFFVYLDDAFGSHLRGPPPPGSFYWAQGAYSSRFLIGKEKSQRVPILVSEWLGFAVCNIFLAF